MIRFLDRLGDRAAALSLYETLTQRLRIEYDAEPSDATRELLDALRTHARSAPKA